MFTLLASFHPFKIKWNDHEQKWKLGTALLYSSSSLRESPLFRNVSFSIHKHAYTLIGFFIWKWNTQNEVDTHTRKKIAPKIRSISFGKLKHTLRWMCLWTTTEIIIYYSNNHRRYSHITPQVYFGNVKAADIQPNMFYLPACLWADGCVLFSISRIIK